VLDVLLSGLLTGYAIAVPVGAVAVMIIAISARTSWRTGAAAGLGVATVDGGYALVAVLAGTAVANALAPVEDALTAVSVVVLLGIAVLTLVINPATVPYFAAIVLGGSVDIDGPAEGSVFVAAAFLASASWQVFVASVGAGMGTWISGPRGRRTTGVLAALVIAAWALRPDL
jgi:threonine/homoserine/homoserine lactone efflux protein